jgi:ubiquinone/menaquinone biosynthesis C-methylase UbiE
MTTISSQKTGQTSEGWKDGFLDIRKSKIISFVNKKRLRSTGFLERIKTNATVCDAGCGDLSLLDQLKDLGYQNLCGFDIDAGLINSSSKHSLSENGFLKVKVGSICKIPFDDESFDAVIIWGIFHHIDPKDYKIVLHEIIRILKPKGEFFIVDPYPHILWKTLCVILGFLSFFSKKFKNIYALLASENDLFKNFSNNRKVLKEVILNKSHKIHSKWHTGMWIFGGIRK